MLLTNKVKTEEEETGEAGECSIVKINSGGGGTCASVAYNGFCVWPGKRQSLSVGATMCNPWSDGSDIWIMDCRACNVTGTAPNGDRFLAYSTGTTFNPAGVDERPLYAIKSEQTGGDDSSEFAIIRITGTGCAAVDDDSNCLFQATVQVAGSGPSACNLWSDGAQIYAVEITQCSAVPVNVLAGDLYLAVKVASGFGPSGDQRQLYAFRKSPTADSGVVEIVGEADECEQLDQDEACLWEGKLLQLASGGEDLCDAFEQDKDVYVVQVNKCDRNAKLRAGERYIGLCVGSFESKQVYAVQASAANEFGMRWAKCATQWYRSDGPCDYVAVAEITSCDDETQIPFDQEDPNYDDSFPTDEGPAEGYKVYLPRLPAPNGRDPNLNYGDIIAYQKTKDGKYVCVTDYLDDPIGTVVMQVGEDCERAGWALMDGTENHETKGGSGVDMRTFFPRMPSQEGDNGEVYGLVGETGGGTVLVEEELTHVHFSEDTEGLCKGLDTNVIIDDSGAKYYPQCWVCMKDSTWERYEGRTKDGLLPGYGEWGDDDVPGEAALPIEDPCFPTEDEKVIPWGPINITPRYRNLQFIERIDNSQLYTQ